MSDTGDVDDDAGFVSRFAINPTHQHTQMVCLTGVYSDLKRNAETCARLGGERNEGRAAAYAEAARLVREVLDMPDPDREAGLRHWYRLGQR